MPIKLIALDDENGTVELLPAIPADCYPRLCAFLESLGFPAEWKHDFPGPGRPGVPVAVIAIDADASMRLKIQPGDVFPSGVALSEKLGFNFNAVGQALNKSAREQERAAQAAWDREGHPGKHTSRIRPQATIRGVTCMLEKDLPG